MKYFITISKIILSLGLFIFIFRKFNIQVSSLVAQIRDWRYLLLAIFMPLTIIPFISINRWQLFLRLSGVFENFFTLWYINLKALFHGLIIPSTQGFDALRIYYIEKRNPNRRGHAGSTVLVERMIGFVMLCLLSLFSILIVAQLRELPQLLLTILSITGALFIILTLILSKKIHGFYAGHAFNNKMINRILGYINRFHGAVVYFPYRKILLKSLIWIAGYQIAIIFTIYLVFLSYGYAIPFVQHLAIYPVIAILSMVPITLGGFGVREGFFVFFYSLIGIPPTVAVGVSIMQYIIITMVPASLGGFLFLWESIISHRN